MPAAPQQGLATVPSATGVPAQGVPPQSAACVDEFLPLRQEAEKRAALISAAAKRKAPREEMCQLFNGFVAAEGKVVRFMETKHSACGIPTDAVASLKKEHARVMVTRGRVCSTGPVGGPGGPPPGPSLSEALGAPRIPGPGSTSSGLGTWDTLTGNPIKR
jgi:hypothetical protein